MSDNKRFYWLKLKEDFFEDDTIQWLEEQDNGREYALFYLKLCLKSLKTDGSLIRFVGQKLIPYDKKALAKLTNTDPDTVAVAMNLFQQIGLVDLLESGEIYLTQINEMVGSETDKAALMRKKRAREVGNNVTPVLPDVNQSKEKELDLEKELKNKEQKPSSAELTDKFESLWKLYPNKKGKPSALKSYKKAIKNGATDEIIKQGIENYNEYLAKNTWLKPAHGSTWFNQERWTDEYDEEVRSGGYDTSEYDDFF